MARPGILPQITIALCILLYLSIITESTITGCREGKDMRKCENVCMDGKCEIRAAVILSKNTTLIASESTVMPTLILAEESIREMGLINENVTIEWMNFDDQCDASYSLISAIDAYADGCVHVIFGPVCEYALASVARITKFLGYYGTPQLTVGGLSFDFVKTKKTCEDEYHMLRRLGMVNFQDISHFIIDLMNNFHWKKTAIVYESEGQYEVIGKNSCYLMTKSLSQLIKDNNKTYVPLEARPGHDFNYKENLRSTLGLTYSNAFIGPGCEYVIAPVARYAGKWEIPVLTSGGQAEAFESKSTVFPTLTRMMGGYKTVGQTIQHILEDFGWNTVGMMYHDFMSNKTKGHSLCYLTMSSIHNFLEIKKLAMSQSKQARQNFDEESTTKEEYIKLLKILSKHVRIVVLCASPKTVRKIMLAAEELKMVSSGEYVFFNIELFSSQSSMSSLEPWKVEGESEEENSRAKEAYTAMLTVTTRTPEDEKYRNFSTKVKDLAKTKYNYTFGNESVSTFVTAFYDAVLLYALALNETLQEKPELSLSEVTINGSEILGKMWNRTFEGITGYVTIDGNGDRIASYSMLDMDPVTGRFEVVANYIAASRTLTYVEDRKIHWAGGRAEAPRDTPECGFDKSLCPDKSFPDYAILSIVLSVVVVLVGTLSVIFYRRYKLNLELTMMTWRIDWAEIIMTSNMGKQKGSVYSLVRRGSHPSMTSFENMSLCGDRQMYVPWGFYRGSKVAIKRVVRPKIDLTRPLLIELKKMKDLQHDHLARFYGACIDQPNCCLIIEYCPKGSLQDILEDDQFSLDWMFKVSLMHDIARGMAFLHGTDIRSHGSLKSTNCVVDSRFVLKITDFGLHDFRTPPAEFEDNESYSYWKKKLWTSPEILRADDPPPDGTPKGDVYSFGIIIHEIVFRNGVFWIGDDRDEISPKDLIDGIKAGRCPKSISLRNEPLRPRIEITPCENEKVIDILKKCWNEEPTERPGFGELKNHIRKLNKEHESGNILDNLLSRMEQYANNLEAQVEERTADYLEEKRKCEELLYQLLPKSVASQLIRGQSVVAETYDKVTIYFSDIVGFTQLSAESTPLEVVDLLNDLYTCFDSIVENFDVYKVETIGDAYMVVSGLPTRNGNFHAREIARMSLALLENVRKFQIRHRPYDQLKLRIGIHSGPCVAGVVGLKMPRYCLFGDTVNTASRMESNGEALKIHVSPFTKEILDKFGTFDLTCRGPVSMKGKGTMTTYWLDGETIIPDPVNLESILALGNNKNSICSSDPPSIVSMTPFAMKIEQHLKSSSRRGSAIIASPQGNNLNGCINKEFNNSNHNIFNNLPKNINSQLAPSVSFCLDNHSKNKDSYYSRTPPAKPKINRGNNNWIPKLASPENTSLIDQSSLEKPQDFSASVPLLTKVRKTHDSIV